MLEHLFDLMGGLLRASDVVEVLAEHGVRERRRGGKLPPELTFWLVLQLALNRRTSIRSLLGELGLGFGLWGGRPPHSTSVAKARDRIGWAVFRAGLRRLRPQDHVDDRWRGKIVIAVDGSCFRAPNTSGNVATLGKPTVSQRTANWPMLRSVLAVGVHSHWIYDAAFAPYQKWRPDLPVGEVPLLASMVERFPENALLVGDRAYSAFSPMKSLLDAGLDFVIRARKNSISFKPRAFERLEDNTDLVRVRRKTTREEVVLRRIRFSYATRRTVPKKNRKNTRYERSRSLKERTHVTLLTTLVDPDLYPKEEIAKLYHQRWEVEHVFKELKAQLAGGEIQFRSQTLARVIQEAFATLIVFNGTRALAGAAARRAAVPLLRISFELTVSLLRSSTKSRASSQEALLAWLAGNGVLPKRRIRHYPRTVLARTPKYAVRKARPGAA